MAEKATPAEYQGKDNSFIIAVKYYPGGTSKKSWTSTNIKSSDHIVQVTIRNQLDTKSLAQAFYKMLRTHGIRVYKDPVNPDLVNPLAVLNVAFYSHDEERAKYFMKVLGEQFVDCDAYADYRTFLIDTGIPEEELPTKRDGINFNI